MSYWTQYWTNETVRNQERGIKNGEYDDKFDHIAGNMFRARGVLLETWSMS